MPSDGVSLKLLSGLGPEYFSRLHGQLLSMLNTLDLSEFAFQTFAWFPLE